MIAPRFLTARAIVTGRRSVLRWPLCPLEFVGATSVTRSTRSTARYDTLARQAIGTPSSTPPQSFSDQARKCQANRCKLKSSVPFRDAPVESTDAYIRQYYALTGLTPEQVSELFRRDNWRPCYGGEKWAVIADTVIELKAALDSSDTPAAVRACERLKGLEHNSGPLVPTRECWEASEWQQEKWPELCEG